jgi:hypothetical protein
MKINWVEEKGGGEKGRRKLLSIKSGWRKETKKQKGWAREEKKMGLEVNAVKNKYVLLSCHQIAR